MNGRRRNSPVFRGVVTGAGAYVLGYLVTYLLVGHRAVAVVETIPIELDYGQVTLGTRLGETGLATWKAVGWLFYGEHLVTPSSLSFPVFFRAPISLEANVEVLGAASAPYLLVLPPVLLVLAGLFTTWPAPSHTVRLPFVWAEYPVAARQGAWVAVGYAPLVFLGALLLGVSIPGDTSVGLDPFLSVLVAGVAYPVVFGGVAGWLRHQYADLTTSEEADGKYPET